MPIITGPSSAIQPVQIPDVVGDYGRLMMLKNQQQEAPLRQQALQQQVQAGAIENEQRQTAENSQKALMRAYTEANGDLAKTVPLAAKYGAAPDALVKLQQAAVEQQSANIKLLQEKGSRALQEADLYQGAHDAVAQVPAEQRPAAYQQQVQGLQQAGIDVSQLPPQYPGDEAFKTFGIALKGHKQQLDDLAQQANMGKTVAQTSEANAKANEATVNATLAPQKVANDTELRKQGQQRLSIESARLAFQQRQGGTTGATGPDDIKDTAKMIQDGQAPPVLTEYSFRDRTKLAGELHRQGYNLAQAEQDWKATQKYIGTLNGAQQTRLRQAIQFTDETIPQIQDAFNEWKKTGLPSGFQVFNTAALKAAENMPGKAGSAAHNLNALISDFTSELGTVYKGGNSSTDESLKLAAQNLGANWNEQTFTDALTRIQRSIKIRKNSINAGSPVGVSSQSPYPPKSEAAPAANNDPLGLR